MYGYIYLNTYPNKYFYIGQHKYNKPEVDPNYSGSSTFAKRYGWVPSNIEILRICDSAEELNQAEREIIDLYLNEYGVAPCVRHHNPRMAEPYKDGIMLNEQMGGNVQVLSEATIEKMCEIQKVVQNRPDVKEKHRQSQLGKRHTQATKEKMSKAQQGKHATEATKDKMSKAQQGENNGMFGKRHTQATKDKMSKAKQGVNNGMFGKHHTEATKESMSKANQGQGNKSVYCYNSETCEWILYVSRTAASEATQVDRSNISKALQGKLGKPNGHMAGGYYWFTPEDAEKLKSLGIPGDSPDVAKYL